MFLIDSSVEYVKFLFFFIISMFLLRKVLFLLFLEEFWSEHANSAKEEIHADLFNGLV